MITFRTTNWLDTREVKVRVDRAVVSGLARCAAVVEREAKALLSRGGGTGRARGPLGAGFPASSAPGQPPLLRSGVLRSSIRYARTARGSYVIGPSRAGWYGRVHEFGCTMTVTQRQARFLAWRFGVHVKPGSTITIPRRPFMGPALRRAVAQFPRAFAGVRLGGTV
jgi:hypothetical protein